MTPKMKPLCAMDELRLERLAAKALPLLLGRGLRAEDALAIAGNTALVSLALEEKLSPREVLRRFGLEEIAALCEQYAQLGARPEGWEDGAQNAGYGEVAR